MMDADNYKEDIEAGDKCMLSLITYWKDRAEIAEQRNRELKEQNNTVFSSLANKERELAILRQQLAEALAAESTIALSSESTAVRLALRLEELEAVLDRAFCWYENAKVENHQLSKQLAKETERADYAWQNTRAIDKARMETEKQLAEYKEDAERYRGLRMALSDRTPKGRSRHLCSIPEGQPEEIDLTIDAAQKEKS